MIWDKTIAKLCFVACFCVSFISIHHCLLQMSISDIMALKLSLCILKNDLMYVLHVDNIAGLFWPFGIWKVRSLFVSYVLQTIVVDTVLSSMISFHSCFAFPVEFKIYIMIKNLELKKVLGKNWLGTFQKVPTKSC